MDSTQNIISFCTGYGGIELGLRRTGLDFRTVCYVEIEAFAQANLVAKIEQGKMDSAPIWSNLKTFPARQFSGKVHGIIGGYPCQPFSHAGKRAGTDDPRHLWPYIEQHIGTIEPLWCFFENVGGHLSLGFEEVAQSLRDMGYQVEAGLFTAAEVGAPHKRQRLFILGYTRSCGQYWIARRGTNKVATDRHCELAYPQSQRCGKAGASGKRQEERDIRTSSMADSERPESGAGTLEGSQTGIRGPRSPINSTELAHTAGERTQGYEPEGHDSTEGQADELRYNRWPARPGEVQQYWEEPRTVESGMGRTVDGFRSRVDELRLLGNGVVPQQTELAFRTLIERKMTWTG